MQPTILVVEDDPHIRSNIVQLLSFEGYQVSEAADGYEGLQKAIGTQPSLILCDVTMPKMDGFALLNEIRHTSDIADTAFIFLTARSARQDMRQAMSNGADDYITKPFSDSELLDAVSARLARLCDPVEPEDVSTATESGVVDILVVQQSPTVIKFIERAAMAIVPDHNLRVARTDEDVQRFLDEHRFSLAVIEEAWSDDKGMVAVRAVRNSVFNRDTPIMVILDSEKSPNLNELRTLNVHHTLVRPISVDALQRCLQEALSSQQKQSRETLVRQTPRLIFSIIEDADFFRPLENFMSARYRFVSYPTWPEAMKAMTNVIPEMLFYDVQPGLARKEWFAKLQDLHVRTIQMCELNAEKNSEASLTIPKSPEIRNSLNILVRDVFHYTGDFEYNVLEFLKEFLLNVFTEALKRQIQNHTLPTQNVAQHQRTTDSGASDRLIAIIRCMLSDHSNEISFVFHGNYDEMRDIMIEAERGLVREPVLSDVLNYWNNSAKLIALRLQRVLSMYGLEHEPLNTITRVSIDQIKEDYHWCIESSLTLNSQLRIGTKFGVSLATAAT